MARVKIHRGKPFRAVLDAWASKDGVKRADKVANAMRAGAPARPEGYSTSIIVTKDRHPSRYSFHIGSLDFRAGKVEADTGNAVRSIDAAK